jgi:poly(3-hydroxybutyrate) depolymerase
VLEWRDADGSPRYACVVAPRGVEARAPLPLVVFFHGPEDDPTSVDKKTGLRKLAARFDLSGDPAHVGFMVLSLQGRALKGGRGSVFDTDFTGATNVDVAAVDHFVEELASKGLVDRRRIYALGNAEGGTMAATYAMIRADRVAAFAAYATEAPRASWSCGGPPPPALMIYRACDDAAPCETVERWLRARDAASAETPWVRLGAANEEEPSCAVRNKCTKSKGSMHHARWPKQREEQLLRFFASHALALPAAAAAAGSAPPEQPAEGPP